MYLLRTMSNLQLLVPSTKNSSSIQVVSSLEPLQVMEKIEREEKRELGEHKQEEEEEEEEEERCKVVVADVVSSKRNENDDDGYHTPTSPSHRIPKGMECPPAPKKPSHLGRTRKRKACCSIEIMDVEFMFGVEMDNGDQCKRRKEDREEATIDKIIK